MNRKLGKLPVRHDKRTILFKDIVFGVTPDFPMALRRDDRVPDVTSMYLNDQIGDCTCASIAHLEEVWTSYGAVRPLLTTQEVIDFYSAVGGYHPGDESSDNGADMLTVLKMWRNIGIGQNKRKLDSFVKIDQHEVDHVKSAVNLFAGVYVGVQLPLTAQKALDNGLGWYDVNHTDAGTWGGHCLTVSHYDRSGVWFRTWGVLQRASWQWWTTYVDECYGVISPVWVHPNGLDMPKLREYLAAL